MAQWVTVHASVKQGALSLNPWGPHLKKKIMHACSPSIRELETDGSQDLEGQPLEQELPVQGETLCQKLRWRGIIEDS